MSSHFKIWRSLTEPLMYHGITFDYVVALIAFSMVTYVYTLNSVIITIIVFVIGLIFGVIMSRRDKRWFSIIRVNLRHFGIKAFRKVKYVR